MQKKTLLSIVVCFTMTTLYAQKTEPADTLKGQTLDEVVVAQRRKLIKNDIDKLTYDVQHDKTAQTKTTLEILKKIPLVTVDGQENLLLRSKGLRLSLIPVPNMMQKGLQLSSISS